MNPLAPGAARVISRARRTRPTSRAKRISPAGLTQSDAGPQHFEGRIAFIEDYEMHVAHRLVLWGVDLWLNLPRVPLEASGTSGMKAALNGVPQLSTF